MKFIIGLLLCFTSMAQAADFTITIQGGGTPEKKWTLKNGASAVAVLSLTPTPNNSEYRHITSKAYINISNKTFNGWGQIFYESNNCTGTPYAGYYEAPQVTGNNGTLYIPINVNTTSTIDAQSRRSHNDPACETDNFGDVPNAYAMKLCGADCNFTTSTVFTIVEE